MSKISLLLRNRRVLLSLVVILILAIAIPILAFALKDKLITSKKIQPKLVKETTTIQAALESHPKLFLAEIEYNPKTGVVIHRRTNLGRGDLPPFFSDKPSEDLNRVSYKVEVVTQDNIILQSGWYSDYKQKLETKENTLRFQIVTGYQSGAIIKLYYPTEDKLIWIGKIQ